MIKKLVLLSILPLCLCSCEKKPVVKCEDVIVNKEVRRELDNGMTWLLDVPQMRNAYYFILKEYGDKEVDQNTFGKYKIGDVYTWEQR